MTGPIKESYDSIVPAVDTPDGKMFVIVLEQEGAPRGVLIEIGKSGTSVRAWADALARIVTLALRSGLGIERIIEEVSNITTDRLVRSRGTRIRSGPEGFAFGLLLYTQEKSTQLRKHINDLDDGNLGER